MSDMLGRQVHVALAKEGVARGTEGATKTWIGKLDFDFKPQNDTIQNTSGYGHIAKNSRQDVVRSYGAGGFTTKIYDKSVGHLFNMIFGQSPTSAAVAGATGAFDNTWALLNSTQHLSYSISTVEGDVEQKVYVGAVLDEATIDVVTDDYAKIKASFLSRNDADKGTSLTPAYTAENEFIPKHASVLVAPYGTALGSATVVADVTEAHVTISKNPTNRATIGNADVDPRNTVMEVKIELHLFFNATTFRTYWENQTQLALWLKLVNTDVQIGTGTPTNPAITLGFPLVQVSDWDPDYGSDDLVQQTITLQGLLDVSTGTLMTGAIRNTNQSTAY